VQGGLASKWFVTLLGADHLGPYQGVAPWAAVVDAVTTQFFELELKGQSSSASAQSIAAAGSVAGVSQIATSVSGSTMPQVPLVGGC
jgi:hypothetical protein